MYQSTIRATGGKGSFQHAFRQSSKAYILFWFLLIQRRIKSYGVVSDLAFRQEVTTDLYDLFWPELGTESSKI